MKMSSPSVQELDTYPHEYFAFDIEFNPQRIVDEYTVDTWTSLPLNCYTLNILLNLLSLLHANKGIILQCMYPDIEQTPHIFVLFLAYKTNSQLSNQPSCIGETPFYHSTNI
jgi:hypothetical protein